MFQPNWDDKFEEDDLLSLSSDSEPSLEEQEINQKLDEEDQAHAGTGVKIEKRHYHNLLERNRRNVLKYGFAKLRNAIPTFAKKNARASRAKILKRSIEFIRRSEQKKAAREKEVRDMQAENKILEEQIRAMEAVRDDSHSGKSTDLQTLQNLLQQINSVTYKEHAEEPSDTEEDESDDSDDANEENENNPDAAAYMDEDEGDQNRAPLPPIVLPATPSSSESEDSTDSD